MMWRWGGDDIVMEIIGRRLRENNDHNHLLGFGGTARKCKVPLTRKGAKDGIDWTGPAGPAAAAVGWAGDIAGTVADCQPGPGRLVSPVWGNAFIY